METRQEITFSSRFSDDQERRSRSRSRSRPRPQSEYRPSSLQSRRMSSNSNARPSRYWNDEEDLDLMRASEQIAVEDPSLLQLSSVSHTGTNYLHRDAAEIVDHSLYRNRRHRSYGWVRSSSKPPPRPTSAVFTPSGDERYRPESLRYNDTSNTSSSFQSRGRSPRRQNVERGSESDLTHTRSRSRSASTRRSGLSPVYTLDDGLDPEFEKASFPSSQNRPSSASSVTSLSVSSILLHSRLELQHEERPHTSHRFSSFDGVLSPPAEARKSSNKPKQDIGNQSVRSLAIPSLPWMSLALDYPLAQQ